MRLTVAVHIHKTIRSRRPEEKKLMIRKRWNSQTRRSMPEWRARRRQNDHMSNERRDTETRARWHSAEQNTMSSVARIHASGCKACTDTLGRNKTWTNIVFAMVKLASKVGIESPCKIQMTCGLLGKVMEWRRSGPGFHSQWCEYEFDFYFFRVFFFFF